MKSSLRGLTTYTKKLNSNLQDFGFPLIMLCSSLFQAPSPATPAKSPDKSQDSPLPVMKKEGDIPLILRGSSLLDVPSQPGTPRSTPPSPATPQSIQDMGTAAGSPTVPLIDSKNNVVKPGILRYNNTSEEFQVGNFVGNKPATPGSLIHEYPTFYH